MSLQDIVEEHMKSYLRDGSVKEIKICERVDNILNMLNFGTVAYTLSLLGIKHLSETASYLNNGLVRWFVRNLGSSVTSKMDMLQDVSSYYGDMMKALPYVLGAFIIGNVAGAAIKKYARTRIKKRHLKTLASLTKSRKYKGSKIF
jgi:hypothetical protein